MEPAKRFYGQRGVRMVSVAVPVSGMVLDPITVPIKGMKIL